jgi:putative ABC transport system permease protein
MKKNQIIINFRRFSQNKMSTIIKLLSLSIGMVCFSLIAVYVYYELGYDHFNKHADEIARVTMEYSVNGTRNQWAVTGTKAGPQLQRTFPSVKSYVRMIRNSKVVKNKNIIYSENNFLFVDSGFLKIFTFPMIEGTMTNALDGPGKIVLTRTIAKKYFGNDDPLGKSLTIDSNQNYTITGIVEDVPDNSQIKFDFLASFVNLDVSKTEEWFAANYFTFLLLEKGTDIADLDNKINGYMKEVSLKEKDLSGIDYFTLHLEPLTRIHLHSNLDSFIPNTPFVYIYVLIIIAMLILMIACINYSNITIAQVSGKRTEIGIRKLLGAGESQLFWQFVGEAGILIVIAAILSIIGAMVLMPYFSILTGKVLTGSLLFQPVIIGTIILLCVIVSLIAGAYPAMIISGQTLNNILKPGSLLGVSGGKFRKSLIVFQFVISIVLIITTIIIQQQRSFIQGINLGYDKTKVIFLPIGAHDWPGYYNLKSELKQDPFVKEVSAGNTTPVNITWTSVMIAATETGKKQFNAKAIPVDLDFLQTLGIKIIAGSDFTESDLKQVKALKNKDGFKYSMILNETAVKEIGWTPEESIGRQLDVGFTGTVKAVIKDFHLASLHEPVMPLVIFLLDEYQKVILIKINGNDVSSALSSIKKIWNGRIVDRPFEYHFLDEEYDRLYKNEQNTARIFSTFSAIAILLACLGLFGIVAIMTVQRTKEIGIRKIMGATVVNIIMHFFADYLKPVFIAFIISVPLAYYFANKWLLGFAYHIAIPVWAFIISGIFCIAISVATISIQSLKAALSNPVDSLRNE